MHESIYLQILYIYYFFVEPFIESIPTVIVQICLIFRKPYDPLLLPDNFWISFSISLFTATFGIAKTFKIGSCRLVPNEGIFGGFFQLGFILLFINIAFTFLAKGLLLGYSILMLGTLSTSTFTQIIGFWIGLNVLPQFLFVSKIKWF